MSNVIFEVSFNAGLAREEMPSSYLDPKYLEEVIREAIEDAMYDLGCDKVEYVRVEVEGL